MTQLQIRLLGSFEVRAGSAIVDNFESNKTRSLLAYVVVQCNQKHAREKLAELLWPEMPALDARANLSRALHNVRKNIDDACANPPYLLCTRSCIQWNTNSNYWLDVHIFNEVLERLSSDNGPFQSLNANHLRGIEMAVNLYQSEFMSGIDFQSSRDFDEWLWAMRQQLQHRVLNGLNLLTAAYEQKRNLSQAIRLAWRQLEINPVDERAYRQLIWLLTASGQRSQALQQFDHLQSLLDEELGVAPESETIALREQICNAA